jgi:hypothetical protein
MTIPTTTTIVIVTIIAVLCALASTPNRALSSRIDSYTITASPYSVHTERHVNHGQSHLKATLVSP